ncbi:MAG: CHASE3 domain-containing protein [Pyrinomonadaceae bacterium]
MRLTLERQIPLAFLVAFILLVTIGFFAYRRITTLAEAIKWEKHTQEVLLQLDGTLTLMVDAETSGHGFVITGDESFLEPYNHTTQVIDEDLNQLHNLTADNAEQTQKVLRLRVLTNQRLSLIRQFIDARRTQGLNPTVSQLSVQGKSVMDEIRSLIAQMKDSEKDLLVKRETDLDNSISETSRILVLGGIAGILSLGLANLAIFRETGKRSRAENALKEANHDLEKRVEERTLALGKTNEELKTEITRREQSEETTRQSEIFTRAILDSLPAHIAVLDKDGTIIEVNRGWNNFAAANCVEEKISATGIGQNYLSVCEKSAAFEEDTQKVLGNLRAILNGEQKEFSFEYPCHSPSEENWFLMQVNPMESGTVVSHINITARKKAEQTLVERERLSLLNSDVSLALIQSKSLPEILQSCAEAVVKNLDAAFVRIWTLNQKENMLELEASAGMYTHTDGAHSRVPVGKLKIGRIAEERKPHLTNSVIGDPQVGNQEWAKREGMVAFAGYPLIIGERMVGVVAVFARQPLGDDAFKAIEAAANIISLSIEHKQAEAEREKLLEREQAARKDAEIANRLRDEFLATVSHELRAPLNSILGWSRLMQQGKLDEKTLQKAIETIVRNANVQNRLIEDLLDVSRIISGKLRLEIMTIKPISFVEAALETVRPAAEAKNIVLEVREDSGISHISGDPNRLQQVVWNLLSNAIKFTPNGGGVAIEIERADSRVEIRVKDTGVGIKPEFLPHVFDRFSQADASSIRKFGGLGLGLAIVRHLTEMHGGTVRAHSEGEGAGSTFIVGLPVAAAPPDEEIIINVNQPFLESETNLSLDGLLILVVDDEEDTRQLLVQSLTNYGATVITANSAESGLQAVENQKPDVLVSDIGMPDEDGYSLIRKVRALDINIPAVALTAFTRAQDRMRALAAGFQNHVSKPVEPEELATVIASLTGRLQINDGE